MADNKYAMVVDISWAELDAAIRNIPTSRPIPVNMYLCGIDAIPGKPVRLLWVEEHA